MFSIGSFTSIMPIILLTITYLAGLTTYSISFAKSELYSSKTDTKTIQVKNTPNEKTKSVEFLKAENKFIQASNSEIIPVNSSYYSINKIRFEHQNTTYCIVELCHNLSMRPPPSIL